MFYLPEERGAWWRVSLQHAHPTPYTLLIALVKLCSERDIKDYTFNDSVAVWPHNGKGTSRALTILFLCSFWPLGLPALDEENNTQHPLSTHWAPTEHPPAPAYIPTCTTQVFIQKKTTRNIQVLYNTTAKQFLTKTRLGLFWGPHPSRTLWCQMGFLDLRVTNLTSCCCQVTSSFVKWSLGAWGVLFLVSECWGRGRQELCTSIVCTSCRPRGLSRAWKNYTF